MARELTVPIAVALVEDNVDSLLAASSVLAALPGVTVVGEFGTAEAFLDSIERKAPDVVLMDIGLPGMSGIEAVERLRARAPETKAIILSVHEDDENVFRAICGGAIGYLAKPVMPAKLQDAVESAFAGGTPMSPHIARRVLEMFRTYAPAPQAAHNLTDREIGVLERLVDGDGYKDIADALSISIYTVRAHLRNIYEKLHVHSKSQAVSKALQERMLRRR
jgi:DNA-binding NarL/FixJ family response regulator